MKAKKSKKIDWTGRIPYIEKMMKTLSDAQIAKIYGVKRDTLRGVRRYHKLFRPHEKLYMPKEHINPPRELGLKWSFYEHDLTEQLQSACLSPLA